MIDPDLVRRKIELTRRAMENIGTDDLFDQATRLQLESLREYCEMLIRVLETYLS